MKTYIIEDSGIGYPVGHSMNAAMRYVKNLVNIFIKDILIEYENTKYINIWCRGSSGSILASLFSFEFYNNCSNKEYYVIIQHIKKEGEKSHDSGVWISSTIPKNVSINIILDDFADSGKTIATIFDKIPDKGKENLILMLNNINNSAFLLSYLEDTFEALSHIVSSERTILKLPEYITDNKKERIVLDDIKF